MLVVKRDGKGARLHVVGRRQQVAVVHMTVPILRTLNLFRNPFLQVFLVAPLLRHTEIELGKDLVHRFTNRAEGLLRAGP